MDKKVLVIYYTQSGQLKAIADRFLKPFYEANASVEVVAIEPEKPFPFPWTSREFFDAMPESVLTSPAPLKPFASKENRYDLIIFAYQPWYLSPSIPANSILQYPGFKTLMKDTPVVTLIGARNMWLNAQEKVKKLVSEAGGKIVGNVAQVDRHGNLASVVSILYWMLTGKKEKYLGVFPKPGVSDEDIQSSDRYGAIVLDFLKTGNWQGLPQALASSKAVEVKSNLMFIEGRAGRLFQIWANFIIKRKNRAFWLSVFKYYLIIALFLVAPIVLLINMIFFKPFLGKSIERKKRYYMGLN